MAAILVINNQKGGVGKSSTSFNVVKTASEKFKLRTCLADLDAQKNSTNSLCASIPRDALLGSMLFNESIPAGVQPITISPYLDLIPGDKGLKKVDSFVHSDDRAARRALYHQFRKNLRSLSEKYELIVLDTPTTAEHRYMAALVAADFCLSPTTLDAYGMDGIADTKETIRDIRSVYGNPKLKDLGLMPNMVEKRSQLHAKNLAELQGAGIKLFSEIVFRRSDIPNKLYLGKRSPVMLPVVQAILKEMKL